MGLFGKKSKAKSDADILLDALGGVKKREERKRRVMFRKMSGGWKRFLDSRILIGLGVILVLFIGDGVRRENREFEATLAAMTGQVWVQETDTAPMAPAVTGEKLTDGNVVVTGTGAEATLSFADGSVLIVGPGSSMTVKLLEYNRGAAWRSRAFYVKVGTVWAKVSQNFGKGSTMKVYTPSSVAAVRGTTFYVYQARSGAESEIACAEGEVRVRGFTGVPVYLSQGAVANVTRGRPPNRPAWMSTRETESFMNSVLWRPPPNASKLQVFEYAINQFLNAPLNILGIGKCGWALGAVDSTRRSAAMEAMRRLQIHLEGNAEYPAYVNPATLEELGLDWLARKQILDQLYGNAIDRYIPASGRDYTIYARARDKNRTALKLTSHGVVFCTKDEAAALEDF